MLLSRGFGAGIRRHSIYGSPCVSIGSFAGQHEGRVTGTQCQPLRLFAQASALKYHKRVAYRPSPMSPAMWVFCAINYHLATPALAAGARQTAVYKDRKFSDHAPLTIDYDFML
jgi:hypothetical protein